MGTVQPNPEETRRHGMRTEKALPVVIPSFLFFFFQSELSVPLSQSCHRKILLVYLLSQMERLHHEQRLCRGRNNTHTHTQLLHLISCFLSAQQSLHSSTATQTEHFPDTTTCSHVWLHVKSGCSCSLATKHIAQCC